MFVVSYGAWTASLNSGDLPYIYDDYVRHAALVDEFDLKGTEGSLCYIGVSSPTSKMAVGPRLSLHNAMNQISLVSTLAS